MKGTLLAARKAARPTVDAVLQAMTTASGESSAMALPITSCRRAISTSSGFAP
jgi:hypothetical protein